MFNPGQKVSWKWTFPIKLSATKDRPRVLILDFTDSMGLKGSYLVGQIATIFQIRYIYSFYLSRLKDVLKQLDSQKPGIIDTSVWNFFRNHS